MFLYLHTASSELAKPHHFSCNDSGLEHCLPTPADPCKSPWKIRRHSCRWPGTLLGMEHPQFVWQAAPVPHCPLENFPLNIWSKSPLLLLKTVPLALSLSNPVHTVDWAQHNNSSIYMPCWEGDTLRAVCCFPGSLTTRHLLAVRPCRVSDAAPRIQQCHSVT